MIVAVHTNRSCTVSAAARHAIDHSFISIQVAILTFSAINGTSRSYQSCSPWTTDISTLSGWLDAVPSLMEGIGHVAAFEALAEAISMLELPSDFTPAPQTPMLHEIMMLWLSDASPAQSNIIASPGQQIHNQFPTHVRCVPATYRPPPASDLQALRQLRHAEAASAAATAAQHRAAAVHTEPAARLQTRHHPN